MFHRTDAAEVFQTYSQKGRATFVVYGVATDYCVRAAALGLVDWARERPQRAGSRVVVASDAIAAVAAEGGAAAVDEMKRAGIAFRATDAILAE